MLTQRDVEIKAHDGLILRADLYLTGAETRRPTLLHRTPYDKRHQLVSGSLDVGRLVEAGYNLVVQDVRGRFGSGGRFEPYIHEADDGASTIDWIAEQPWSEPWVGMVGRSYAGAIQWLTAARAQPPSVLRALSPEVASADFYEGWTYRSGALQLEFCLDWVLADLAVPTQESTPAQLAAELAAHASDLASVYKRPWSVLELLDRAAPFYREWLEHPTRDDYWHHRCPDLSPVTCPSLSVGGWCDTFLLGTLDTYRRLRAEASAYVASRSRLLIGPWDHLERNGFDLTRENLEWFDGLRLDKTWDARVTLFVTGVDEWRAFDDWPPAGCEAVRLFLRSTGDAGMPGRNGYLSLDTPDEEPPDVYAYDPADPCITVRSTPSFDCEGRRDVLRYLSSPFDHPLCVVGELGVVLFVSSSARDTDFTARVVDVDPHGNARIISEGIVRARTQIGTLQPGKTYKLQLRAGAAAHVFLPGHRARLDISSSSVPRFDPNQNTGGPTIALGSTAPVVAINRVHHSRCSPSHLAFPVLRTAL